MMRRSTPIALGDGAEFDRVRDIAAALGDAAGPIGDDTATIPTGVGTLVVSTDVSVEGVHFRREWLSPEEIGWRATMAAMSDLAAAASLPAGAVVALTIPPDASDHDSVAVMRGVGNAARASDTKVLGGDLSTGPVWSIAVTVFGYAERLMSRRGAMPGDDVWVTGGLGRAHAALATWQAGCTPAAAVREGFARPVAQIAAGIWLARHGATAMIDLSDGVGGDAEHVAAASGARLEIDIDALPLGTGVVVAAGCNGADASLYAAAGGEDYELLVTLSPDFAGQDACQREIGVQLTRVGRVVEGTGAVIQRGGTPIHVMPFRHLV